MLCCGVLMEAGFLRYGLALGMRGCASAGRFFVLILYALLFFALFLTFCFLLSPRLIFPSLPSALAFARSLAFPLSLFSFPLIRYLCALFLADVFLPLTS